MKQKKKTSAKQAVSVHQAEQKPLDQAAANHSAPQSGSSAKQPQKSSGRVVSLAKPALLDRLPSWTVPTLLGVALYFCLFLPSGRMSMILTFTALAALLLFRKTAARNLRERFSVPTVGLLAFFLVTGCAAIYAPSGQAAAMEFAKYLAVVPVVLLTLLLAKREQVRTILWIFTAQLSLLAFLCMDSSGLQVFYNGFCTIMDSLGATFGSIDQSITAGRINGLYNNSNVHASMFAVSGLLAIWLTRTGEKKWEKPVGAFLTGLCAMSFFLSMSRGAILCFGLTLILYVVFAAKSDRLSLSFFLLETVVVTLLLSAVAMRFLGNSGSPMPDLLTLLCGPVVYVLDRFVGAPVAAKLAGKGKAIALVCGGLAALAVVYVVAAFNITGGYTFVSGQRLYRTLDLSAGAYTLNCEATGDVTLTVDAVISADAVEDLYSNLYDGPANGAISFTVPEETLDVVFAFYGADGAVVETASLSDGTELPLGYPLIPDFLANRLSESLLSGSSFSYRVQYVKDGLKLFGQRPLQGWGLGGSESWLVSIQSWYYQSKYLHNHVVQTMTDTGLLGTIPFLTALLGSAWLLLRRLKEEREDSLAAVLLACWVMMNLHSLMEINFSLRGYQCMAYVLLALVMVLYPVPLRADQRMMQRLGVCGAAFAALWLAFFGVTYESYRMAHRNFETMPYFSNDQVMRDTEKCISRDIYDPEEMQITYLANAAVLESPMYNGQAAKYAKQLRDRGVYVGCSAVARHYYLPRSDYENLFECSREGLTHLRALADVWNLQYELYFEEVLPSMAEEDFPEFVTQVQATRDQLAEAEANGLEPIELDARTQGWLTVFDEAREMESGEGYAAMLSYVLSQMAE